STNTRAPGGFVVTFSVPSFVGGVGATSLRTEGTAIPATASTATAAAAIHHFFFAPPRSSANASSSIGAEKSIGGGAGRSDGFRSTPACGGGLGSAGL